MMLSSSSHSEIWVILMLLSMDSIKALQHLNIRNSSIATTIALPPEPVLKLRLIGKNNYIGLIEVYVNGAWGGICDDDFGKNEAKVICRQLGYDDADYFKQAATALGLAPREVIFYEGLDCDGHEGRLEDCYYGHHEDDTCSSGFDVAGVNCEKKKTNNSDPGVLGHNFNLLGWGIFIFFMMMTVGMGGRRYRQRHHRPGGQAVATIYSNSAVQIPPTSNPSYPAPPTGTYPSQQYPATYQTAGPHGQQVISNLPPDAPPVYSTAWAQPGHYINDVTAYTPGCYYNPQLIVETHPRYAMPDPTHTTLGGNDPMPMSPPPPYDESIIGGNEMSEQDKINNSDATA